MRNQPEPEPPKPVFKAFDPTEYTILNIQEIGEFTVLKLRYKDAPAFCGVKVLVYKAKLVQLWKQKSLDPHFVETPNYICPIARFRGNLEGWNYAIDWAKSQTGSK